MTMFSMKPQFDLAEFLAVPAPVGARRRGKQSYPRPAAKAAAQPATVAETGKTDDPEQSA
ncbi:hypothetical protein SAMN04490248_11686 [Salinihabitans flavidus]|uniref:Uncharacterized protein n=1 Tax=Salinihabitans flavidus TaxID=569882 RepID=A0A1H8TQU1_9RHOB|nr:hypothetical protein [Salinihabitans flavidus]SEO93379.1 hypothetical protein SAMN04490248_11686 [Salinihabitans flavidus]